MRVEKRRREWYETVSKAVDTDLAVVRMLTLTDFVYEQKKKKNCHYRRGKADCILFSAFQETA